MGSFPVPFDIAFHWARKINNYKSLKLPFAQLIFEWQIGADLK